MLTLTNFDLEQFLGAAIEMRLSALFEDADDRVWISAGINRIGVEGDDLVIEPLWRAILKRKPGEENGRMTAYRGGDLIFPETDALALERLLIPGAAAMQIKKIEHGYMILRADRRATESVFVVMPSEIDPSFLDEFLPDVITYEAYLKTPFFR